jgi:Flp pilus assembly protein TadG
MYFAMTAREINMIYQNFLRKPFSGYSPRHSLRRSMRRRGQALIELALVVIVLMVLTLGLIQYGLIANAKVTMANLAREGARWAAVNGTNEASDGPSDLKDLRTTSIRDRVMEVASYTNLKDIKDANIIIEPPYDKTNPGPRSRGKLVTVTITYDMRNKFILPTSDLIPGLNNFGGLTRVSATMVLE